MTRGPGNPRGIGLSGDHTEHHQLADRPKTPSTSELTDVSATNQRYMTQTDFMSWRMEEDPILRSTIVAVAVLDRSPDQTRFVDMMGRAVELVPLFRQKVIEDPLGLAPPRWSGDEDFDLSWHLRRYSLTEPGTWDGVLDFTRAAEMTAFDTRRPLWEFTVLRPARRQGRPRDEGASRPHRRCQWNADCPGDRGFHPRGRSTAGPNGQPDGLAER